MANITLTKLACERKQDISGKDEPVLYIAGQEVWEGKMGKGDSSSVQESRKFKNSVVVELKEKDNRKYKLLKSWTISDEPQTDSNKFLTASSSGYHYKLYYLVS